MGIDTAGDTVIIHITNKGHTSKLKYFVYGNRVSTFENLDLEVHMGVHMSGYLQYSRKHSLMYGQSTMYILVCL